MFLSRVYLNTKKHDTARALYNRNVFHGALERCFLGEREHPLWRIDKGDGKTYLLIVSEQMPDFTAFIDQFGFDGVMAEIKKYDYFLERSIRTGDVLRFHITANPTVKKDGKRIPLNMNHTADQPYSAVDWLNDRMKANGAEVLSSEITEFKTHKIRKTDNIISLLTADFDGFIRVTDKEKLVRAITVGIGHGKAYGCGMLSVMRKGL